MKKKTEEIFPSKKKKKKKKKKKLTHPMVEEIELGDESSSSCEIPGAGGAYVHIRNPRVPSKEAAGRVNSANVEVIDTETKMDRLGEDTKAVLAVTPHK
jgi:hypothetical protein